jgi:acyl-CoA synthetase (AMP-forming)/AMP-acid ligase II
VQVGQRPGGGGGPARGTHGEVGCACGLLKHGATLSEEALIAWSRQRIANYKVPRYLQMFDTFPLNASNKVLKREWVQPVAARMRGGH